MGILKRPENQTAGKMASNYIWPLSKSTTPDEMNTSFRAAHKQK